MAALKCEGQLGFVPQLADVKIPLSGDGEVTEQM